MENIVPQPINQTESTEYTFFLMIDVVAFSKENTSKSVKIFTDFTKIINDDLVKNVIEESENISTYKDKFLCKLLGDAIFLAFKAQNDKAELLILVDKIKEINKQAKYRHIKLRFSIHCGLAVNWIELDNGFYDLIGNDVNFVFRMNGKGSEGNLLLSAEYLKRLKNNNENISDCQELDLKVTKHAGEESYVLYEKIIS